MGWPAYAPARRIASGAQPGAKALAKALLTRYPRGRNGGIYNVRRIRGKRVLSLHAEGRAIDIMVPSRDYGAAITSALLPHVGKLGIQAIINNRKIWSKRNPRGARYRGVSPHYDHVHIELTPAAARGLTVAAVNAALAGKPVYVPKPIGAPKAPAYPGRPFGQGSRGPAVLHVQRVLGVDTRNGGSGKFGPKTHAKVVAFQKARKHLWPADGVVGPKTYAEIVKYGSH